MDSDRVKEALEQLGKDWIVHQMMLGQLTICKQNWLLITHLTIQQIKDGVKVKRKNKTIKVLEKKIGNYLFTLVREGF